jgi:hypothetical protein
MLLTESQKHYYAALKKLSRKRPQRVIRRPRNKYQAWFYDLSMSRKLVKSPTLLSDSVVTLNLSNLTLYDPSCRKDAATFLFYLFIFYFNLLPLGSKW